MKIFIKHLLFSCLLLSFNNYKALTFTVHNTNDSGIGSLRYAISQALNTDTVRISPNLITHSSDSIVLNNRIEITKSITIIGTYNFTDTLYISGGNNDLIFHIKNTWNVYLDSLVLTNGIRIGTNNSNSASGGAIFFENSDSLFVKNSFLFNNSVHSNYSNVPAYGGAICARNANISINNSKLFNNSAISYFGGSSYGGAICSYQHYNNNSILLKNSIIENNSSYSNSKKSYGGGICNYSGNSYSKVTIINSKILNNIASNHSLSNMETKGGGIYCFKLDCLNSIIAKNSADLGGGACTIDSENNRTHYGFTNIESSTIENNIAKKGAGIYSYANTLQTNSNTKSSITISSSSFLNNSSSSFGGGIYSEANSNCNSANDSSIISIIYSTFHNNTAYNGGAIYSNSFSKAATSESTVNVENSTITSNKANFGSAIYSKSSSQVSSFPIKNNIKVYNSTIVYNSGNAFYQNDTQFYNTNPNTKTLFSSKSSIIANPQNNLDSIDSEGFNLISDSSLTGTMSTDIVGVNQNNLHLGTLQFNGGLTKTHLPLNNSIAINNGSISDFSDAQNGTISDNRRDIGASEKNAGNLCCSNSFYTDLIFACDSITWIDGNTYSENNNDALHSISLSNGYDSIISLELILNNKGIDSIIACDSITWIDGNTYTESNDSAFITLTNSFGCDSIVTLNLIINTKGIDYQTACNSYTWIDGNTYTSSTNLPTFILQNSLGCDSIVQLNLVILSNDYLTDTQEACDSIEWIDGNIYRENNNSASHILSNSMGCDSIITLNFINNTDSTVDYQNSCNSFTWINGQTYHQDTSEVTYTMTNTKGCDSIITLNLSITSPITPIIYDSLGILVTNSAESYQWFFNGVEITNATQQHYIPSENGLYSVNVYWDDYCYNSASFYYGSSSILELKHLEINYNSYNNRISISSTKNPIIVKLYDTFGRLLNSSYSFELQHYFDLSHYKNGMYHFKVIDTDNKVITKKIIKYAR